MNKEFLWQKYFFYSLHKNYLDLKVGCYPIGLGIIKQTNYYYYLIDKQTGHIVYFSLEKYQNENDA